MVCSGTAWAVDVWCMPVVAGHRLLLVAVALSATCTCFMHRNRDGLSPMCAPAFVCGGAAPGPGHVGAVTWDARGLVWYVQTPTKYPSRRPAAWRRSWRECRRTWAWLRCKRMGPLRCGTWQRMVRCSTTCGGAVWCVVHDGSPLVGVYCLLVSHHLLRSRVCCSVTATASHPRVQLLSRVVVVVWVLAMLGALPDLPVGGCRVRSCQPNDHCGGWRRGGDRAGHAGACGRGCGAGGWRRGVGELGRERCVAVPLVLALCGAWCMTGCRWFACAIVGVA